jgi:hypothetical protein
MRGWVRLGLPVARRVPPFGGGAPGSLPRVAGSSGLAALVAGSVGSVGPVPCVPGPRCGG